MPRSGKHEPAPHTDFLNPCHELLPFDARSDHRNDSVVQLEHECASIVTLFIDELREGRLQSGQVALREGGSLKSPLVFDLLDDPVRVVGGEEEHRHADTAEGT